jgi:hypothetical protein
VFPGSINEPAPTISFETSSPIFEVDHLDEKKKGRMWHVDREKVPNYFRPCLIVVTLFACAYIGELETYPSPALFPDKGRNEVEVCVHARDQHAVFFGIVKKLIVPPFKPFHANTEYC